MILCSYLVFSGLFPSATKAIDHYNETRTMNKKGLTINS